MLDVNSVNILEPDPSYTFIRQLNKKYEGYFNREIELECTVSSGRAMVTWYKGDKVIEDGKNDYEINKDLTGNCRLTIKKAKASHAGEYTCKIDKQEARTKTTVKVSEYPFKFTKALMSVHATEKDYVCMECELDEEDGEVKWFRDGEPLSPDKRIQVLKEGKKRKLIFKDVKVSDQGMISCTTNADETKGELVVEYQNRFNKKLKDTNAIERDRVVLEVELQDQTAETEWTLNGKPIETSDRVEIKNLGGGRHQLVFNKAELTDSGEVVCTSGRLTSACKLSVAQGESMPKINFEGDVEGPVTKPLIFHVPYQGKGRSCPGFDLSLF